MDAGNQGANAGAVLIYKRKMVCIDLDYYLDDADCPGIDTEWVQMQLIRSNDHAAYDAYGTAIAVSPDRNTVYIGAPSDDHFVEGSTVSNAGSVYVYALQGLAGTSDMEYVQTAKMTASDYETGDYYGEALALAAGADIGLVAAARADNPDHSCTFACPNPLDWGELAIFLLLPSRFHASLFLLAS